MPLQAVAALAGLTYAFRLAGPLLRDRVTIPAAAERLLATGAAVLLVALAATSALTSGHYFAGLARPAGVLVAAVLATRRLPLPVVVLAAEFIYPTPPDPALAVVAEDGFGERARVVLEQPPVAVAQAEHRP
jgi:hypothetical protein